MNAQDADPLYLERIKLLASWLGSLNGLSAGAIVIVAGFVTRRHVAHGQLGGISLVCFAGSLVLGVFGHFAAAASLGGSEEDHYSDAAFGLTIASALAFVVAVALLAAFGWINLESR